MDATRRTPGTHWKADTIIARGIGEMKQGPGCSKTRCRDWILVTFEKGKKIASAINEQVQGYAEYDHAMAKESR